eukprot:420087-Amphidinium_carterae.1
MQRGWADGPYTAEQLHKRFGKHQWIAARRFGLWQSSGHTRKFRLIDDYSASGHNAATFVDQRLDHGGLDEIASLARCVGCSLATGWVDITDTAGSRWQCAVHADWYKVPHDLRVRTLDLRSAYKQLPVHPQDADIAITCAFHPGFRAPRFWRTLAL